MKFIRSIHSLKYWIKIVLILSLIVSLILWRQETPKIVTGCRFVKALEHPVEEASCQFQLPPVSMWFEWKSVESSEVQTFIWSAFLEAKHLVYSILVIGISSKRGEDDHFCRIWSADRKTQIVKRAVGKGMPDTHLKKYHAWSYICKICVTEMAKPGFVSIVESQCQAPIHVLELQNARHRLARNHVVIKTPEKHKKVNFTACLSPLNRNYDDHRELVEWIEVNRMFGIERFIVYNYSSGHNVGEVLRHYNEEGIVETIPWQIPCIAERNSTHSEEIHYYGQKIALNDCIHRLRNFSRFVINVDVDEIIVPRRSSSYSEMLRRTYELPEAQIQLRMFNAENTAEDAIYYSVKNTFFCKDRSQGYFSSHRVKSLLNNLTDKIFEFDVSTLRITRREAYVYRTGWRSKLIVGTQQPPWLNTHDSYYVSPSLVVPNEEGLLHHYRSEVCGKNKYPPLKEDDYMHRFASQIISRLQYVYKTMNLNPARNTPKSLLNKF